MPCRRICPHLCSSEDIDAVPVEVQGRNGAVMVAHSGMLASARALEVELRFAVRHSVEAEAKLNSFQRLDEYATALPHEVMPMPPRAKPKTKRNPAVFYFRD